MAIALPMPLEAPVTNTTFSCKSMRHHNSNPCPAKMDRTAKDPTALCRRGTYAVSRASVENAARVGEKRRAKFKGSIRFYRLQL
jgi:hypothetical protein